MAVRENTTESSFIKMKCLSSSSAVTGQDFIGMLYAPAYLGGCYVAERQDTDDSKPIKLRFKSFLRKSLNNDNMSGQI